MSPNKGRIGLDSHLLWQSAATIDYELGRLAAGGVQWIREDFPWGALEPTRGTYNWALSDQLMTAAAQDGISVLAIVDYSAPWASSDPSGRGDQLYPPRNPADYATYAAAIVARYGANGVFWAQHPTLPRVPLGGVELWNEPYGYWFWKPNPNPAAYAQLVTAAATAVRTADPTVPILASGDLMQTTSNHQNSPWLAALLAADPSLPKLIDGWTVHPYPSPWTEGPDQNPSSPYSFNRVTMVHDLMVSKNAVHPIWLTEFGWSTATGSPDAVSEATQAAYIGEGLALADGPWSGFVERSFVYSWDRSTGAPGDFQGNFGLRRADDSTKPAWNAITSALASCS